MRDTLATPEAIAYIRKRIAERLGSLSREVDAQLAERTARLARVEERIRGIILMQLDGDRSPTLAEMRADSEAQGVAERAAVTELRARASAPIRLPDVVELGRRVQALDALTRAGDVATAREALRRYLKGGTITCTPEGGGYVARAELVPMAAMFEKENAARGDRAALSSASCAGAICRFSAPGNNEGNALWVPFEKVVAVGWE